MDERKPTEFEQQMADLYNSKSPKEQRAMDRQLKQAQATLMASPYALFRLFPGLEKKSLKPKDPNAL